MRTVPEWFGKDDDARPPATVRARVFLHHGGRCYLSGRIIRPPADAWDLEHIKPLWLARPGENLNRESNLAPALKDAHKVKTSGEATDRAKCDRIRAKHLGIYPPPKRKLSGRGFDKRRA